MLLPLAQAAGTVGCDSESPFLLSAQDREGEIRHIYRNFAFLHCKKLVENGGMFVCKTRHLVLAGGLKVRVCGTLGF